MEEMNYSQDRDTRVKDSAEIFTPDARIQIMLDNLNFDWNNIDHSKTFLDPTCGSGNFLVALLKRGIKPENIYGVDLFQDNVNMTISRLTKLNNNYDYSKNIIHGDALVCDFSFGRMSNTEELF